MTHTVVSGEDLAEELVDIIVMSDARLRVALKNKWRVPQEQIDEYCGKKASSLEEYDTLFKEFCEMVSFHAVLGYWDKKRIFAFICEDSWDPEKLIEEWEGEAFLASPVNDTRH